MFEHMKAYWNLNVSMVYKLKTTVCRNDQLRKTIICCKRIGNVTVVMWKSTWLVVNPISVSNFTSVFTLTPVGRASDSMKAPDLDKYLAGCWSEGFNLSKMLVLMLLLLSRQHLCFIKVLMFESFVFRDVSLMSKKTSTPTVYHGRSYMEDWEPIKPIYNVMTQSNFFIKGSHNYYVYLFDKIKHTSTDQIKTAVRFSFNAMWDNAPMTPIQETLYDVIWRHLHRT